MTHKYYVTYSVKTADGNTGDGRININTPGPIESIEHVKKVEEHIMSEIEYEEVNVFVTSWREYDKPERKRWVSFT